MPDQDMGFVMEKMAREQVLFQVYGFILLLLPAALYPLIILALTLRVYILTESLSKKKEKRATRRVLPLQL